MRRAEQSHPTTPIKRRKNGFVVGASGPRMTPNANSTQKSSSARPCGMSQGPIKLWAWMNIAKGTKTTWNVSHVGKRWTLRRSAERKKNSWHSVERTPTLLVAIRIMKPELTTPQRILQRNILAKTFAPSSNRRSSILPLCGARI